MGNIKEKIRLSYYLTYAVQGRDSLTVVVKVGQEETFGTKPKESRKRVEAS